MIYPWLFSPQFMLIVIYCLIAFLFYVVGQELSMYIHILTHLVAKIHTQRKSNERMMFHYMKSQQLIDENLTDLLGLCGCVVSNRDHSACNTQPSVTDTSQWMGPNHLRLAKGRDCRGGRVITITWHEYIANFLSSVEWLVGWADKEGRTCHKSLSYKRVVVCVRLDVRQD